MLIIAARMRTQQVELPPQNVMRKQVLDRLVLQELQIQRANRAGIKVSDETLNNALKDVAQQNGIELRDLPEALAAQGIEYSSYREQLRKELSMQILRQRDVIGRINVSPREIDQFLERQKKCRRLRTNTTCRTSSSPSRRRRLRRARHGREESPGGL